jgi:hypothetical protein
MSRDALLSSLAAVVERLAAEGAPWGWPREEIASIALRRWDSFGRRHAKAKRVSKNNRVLDLAKGLQAHFEPDVPYTNLSDWIWLAKALTQVLEERAATQPSKEQSPEEQSEEERS